MARRDRLLERILSGTSDRNIPFLGLRKLLLRMGFQERVQGSHHMFKSPGIEGMINLQREGHQDAVGAKGYQVRQVRKVILKHRLRMDE